MAARIRCAVFTLTCTLALASTGFAQSSDVTFSVPLNLTGLSPSISKVTVYCEITSGALPPENPRPNALRRVGNQQDFPVSGGRVVTTATIVVPVAAVDTSHGGSSLSANYSCKLSGYSDRLKGYDVFSASPPAARSEFQLSPTPPDLSGTFNW
jgi:hypothetical protein